MKAPAKRGRSYSTANTYHLLDLIEEIEPCGGEEWNLIASRYNAHFGGESRSCEDLKNKFKTLKGVKKPTGDPSCPPEVIRAKRLQKSLERRMDVQTLEDEYDDDDNQNYGEENENASNAHDDNDEDFTENFDDSDRQNRTISDSSELPSDCTSGPSSSSNEASASSNSTSSSALANRPRFTVSNHPPRAPLQSRKPPLPKSKMNGAVSTQPTTTLRTGLTEDQLKNMTSTLRERSPSPNYSETIAKKRKIDNILEKGSEFLTTPDSGGDNIFKMMVMQNNERDARADEWRREEREREERHIMRREKEEHERLLREERKEERRQKDEEAKLEREERREERREREERDRDERREKADRERSDQMMLLFKR